MTRCHSGATQSLKARNPVTLGGIKIIPDYTFVNAPMPKVVVIPAQEGQTEAMLNWIRTATKSTDVTMSVCTGAFVLASTGLLAGKTATTHHDSYKGLAVQFLTSRCNAGRGSLNRAISPQLVG